MFNPVKKVLINHYGMSQGLIAIPNSNISDIEPLFLHIQLPCLVTKKKKSPPKNEMLLHDGSSLPA